MKTIIREIANETRVRDGQGNVLTTMTGTLATIMVRLVIGGLFLLATSGILGFIIMWITGEVSVDGANFGILG
jgi:hypothetical protein|tara:strand:+ start:277 stop:495 length:219 start_codon:yes stop_codon:yes gene_type:complete